MTGQPLSFYWEPIVTTKIHLSWEETRELALVASRQITNKTVPTWTEGRGILYCYPVPNGGIPAALLVVDCFNSSHRDVHLELHHNPRVCDFIIDDIVDSGKTREELRQEHPHLPFMALVDKLGYHKDWLHRWVVFPWEHMAKIDGPQDNIRRLLQFIGEDVDREGLKETPARVVRSYAELFAGYKQDPKDVMKFFEDGLTDEMVILRDIPMASTCEHHMLPFLGQAHIAYIPDKRIIGVSKLARLLDIYARRLQVQERLCQQVTQALDEHLHPKGSACVIEATHLCLQCRGASKSGAKMVTSSLTGVFRQPEVRGEFLRLIK